MGEGKKRVKSSSSCSPCEHSFPVSSTWSFLEESLGSSCQFPPPPSERPKACSPPCTGQSTSGSVPQIQDVSHNWGGPTSESPRHRHHAQPETPGNLRSSILPCRALCEAPAPAAAGTSPQGTSLTLLGSLKHGHPWLSTIPNSWPTQSALQLTRSLEGISPLLLHSSFKNFSWGATEALAHAPSLHCFPWHISSDLSQLATCACSLPAFVPWAWIQA